MGCASLNLICKGDCMRTQKARLRGVNGEPANPDSGSVIRLSTTPRVKPNARALRKKGIRLQADAKDPQHTFSAYSALKTRLLNLTDQHAVRSLMITSPSPGAGKTITAINMGIQIARHTDRTALLLDLNFRRPAVQRYFGRRGRGGIADSLKRGTAFREILFSPVDRLSVAPSGRWDGDATALFSSTVMADLLQETVSRYKERLVIIDMPSVLECDDVLALSPCVDANLLVVEAGKTGQKELEQSLECLSGTHTLGVVLNRVRSGY